MQWMVEKWNHTLPLYIHLFATRKSSITEVHAESIPQVALMLCELATFRKEGVMMESHIMMTYGYFLSGISGNRLILDSMKSNLTDADYTNVMKLLEDARKWNPQR